MEERIRLSPFREGDEKILFEWINDPKLVRFSAQYKPVHWNSHKEWFEAIARNDKNIVFGIRLIINNELIGYCKLVDINLISRSAEFQIKIGNQEYLSRGYGSEALRLLLNFAWNNLNLHRVYCFVFSDNVRAIRSYEKTGFVKEGLMKEAAFIDGVYKDVVVMGMLKDNKKHASEYDDGGDPSA